MNKINQYIETYGSKKVFFIMTAILMVIGILVSILVNVSQKTFSIEGTRFTYQDRNNGLFTFVDENDEVLKIHEENYKRSPSMYDKIIIEYKGDTIKRVNDVHSLGFNIYRNDQNIYEGTYIVTEFDDGYGSEANKKKEVFEMALFSETLKVWDYVQSGALSGMIVLNFILIPLGVSQITFTETYWHLKHFLDVEGGAPSDFYILMTQWGGALLIFFGIFLPLFIIMGLFSQ